MASRLSTAARHLSPGFRAQPQGRLTSRHLAKRAACASPMLSHCCRSARYCARPRDSAARRSSAVDPAAWTPSKNFQASGRAACAQTAVFRV